MGEGRKYSRVYLRMIKQDFHQDGLEVRRTPKLRCPVSFGFSLTGQRQVCAGVQALAAFGASKVLGA